MNNNKTFLPLIIWGGLISSLFTYLIALKFIGKLDAIYFPSQNLKPLEIFSLCAPAFLFTNYLMFKKFMSDAKTLEQKLKKQIVCWALNESIALIGFVTTMLSLENNGYFALSNIAVSFVGYVLMMPKISK